ncbi:uncharacterized protein LOC116023464 [Ipomoea triloba]|uniref:uncharacterized protein LOC116023464 n=1 Tax=Ipomoea triloba TaxID=35885 RepID=UPI00125D03DC|nr:uncharacterized protein LOC116023464 [Ipomoea triloba]
MGSPIGVRVKQCGGEVWGWGRRRVRGEIESLKRCQLRMADLRDLGDERSVREFGEVQNQYLNLVKGQSDRWRQRAKELWYVGGDKEGDGRPVLACLNNRISADQNLLLLAPITPEESAFIPGRSIVDNVLIAYESFHAMHRLKKGRRGFGALKVDMSKAYDRVEWGFLENVMSKLGFSSRWVSLMRECVYTVHYRVLVEGKEWGPIHPSRGLRQGDALSPCLFILIAESLSAVLRTQEEDGALHGISVARGAPNISHLFFADDCLFFFRANNLEAGVIKAVLDEYGVASGQQVNLRKSNIVFGNNVERDDKEAVCEVLGIREQQGRGKYLGLPGYVGRRKREILGFVKDKVRARIHHWGNRFLSRAGREVLLKTVLQSLPNYAMNVFRLPIGLCDEIEKLMNAFWWGCEG